MTKKAHRRLHHEHTFRFSWRRLRALCIKESKQIVRDPSSALIAIVIPLILLFIFGYGINLDSSKLRLGILVNQQSEPARELINAFTGSPFIDATLSDNRRELIDKLQAGHIRGIVVLPADLDKRLARQGDIAQIQVITDGSEPNTANFVQGYASGIWQIWQQQRAQDRGSAVNRLLMSGCATGLTLRLSASILLSGLSASLLPWSALS